MSRGREIVGLMKEIQAMPEYQLYTQIRDLGMSEFTFLGNYADLEAAINVLCAPSAPPQIFQVRNRDRLDAVMLHIARHLHNFVAASFSLIEHTRNLYRDLNDGKGKKQFPDYQPRVDRDFKHDPLSQFVGCLRNYCQHYRVPAIILSTTNTGPNGALERTIMLDKRQLLQYDRWNAAAKRHLNTMPDRVALLTVAAAYRDKVVSFHDWFGARERTIFASEISRFKAKEGRRAMMTIEDEIDAYSAGISPFAKKEDCFLSMFDSREYAELEQTLPDSRERADKVIEILERDLALTGSLKNKIIGLFQPGL